MLCAGCPFFSCPTSCPVRPPSPTDQTEEQRATAARQRGSSAGKIGYMSPHRRGGGDTPTAARHASGASICTVCVFVRSSETTLRQPWYIHMIVQLLAAVHGHRSTQYYEAFIIRQQQSVRPCVDRERWNECMQQTRTVEKVPPLPNQAYFTAVAEGVIIHIISAESTNTWGKNAGGCDACVYLVVVFNIQESTGPSKSTRPSKMTSITGRPPLTPTSGL